jgi:hypothetical protein
MNFLKNYGFLLISIVLIGWSDANLITYNKFYYLSTLDAFLLYGGPFFQKIYPIYNYGNWFVVLVGGIMLVLWARKSQKRKYGFGIFFMIQLIYYFVFRGGVHADMVLWFVFFFSWIFTGFFSLTVFCRHSSNHRNPGRR